jgi:origin recognition complex subunit 2
VSSENALRQHLTEFRDHDLVRLRPAAGGDLLAVPMEPQVLRQVLQQMDAAAA